MFRSKYKYTKNHGLLPTVAPPAYHSPITSLAILGQNDERQYEVHQNPTNPNIFMLFNDKQYLHRQCSLVLPRSQQDSMSQLFRVTPLADKSLTVYVTNDFKECENNIIGPSEGQNSILWLIYNDLHGKKRQGTHIVLSVFGVENQNELTDLMVIDTPSQMNDCLPDYLKQSPYLKRRIRLGKNPMNRLPYAENGHLEDISSGDDLRKALNKYVSIKNQMQTMKFINYANWNWLQGELFTLSEIQYSQQDNSTFKIIRSHYVLRINQYFKSTGALMLKLGMNIRKMQQRNANLICDNNESKLFKLLNDCFSKVKQRQKYQIYLILEIGHYKTLKDQYQNLVPTSELTTKLHHNPKQIQNASFIYLKHYHDHAHLVALLSQIRNDKESTNIQQYLEGSTDAQKKKKNSKASVNMKSFAYDTFSSLQKKKYRNHLLDGDQAMEQEEAASLEAFIKKTAKLYRQDESEERPETISAANRSAFKKSQNRTEHRMSLFEWGSRARSTRGTKIYVSKNIKGRLSEIERRSADYLGKKPTKQKKYNHLTTIYGVATKKEPQQELHTYISKQERTTKEIVDDIVQKEILELGKDDQLFQAKFYESERVCD